MIQVKGSKYPAFLFVPEIQWALSDQHYLASRFVLVVQGRLSDLVVRPVQLIQAVPEAQWLQQLHSALGVLWGPLDQVALENQKHQFHR